MKMEKRSCSGIARVTPSSHMGPSSHATSTAGNSFLLSGYLRLLDFSRILVNNIKMLKKVAALDSEWVDYVFIWSWWQSNCHIVLKCILGELRVEVDAVSHHHPVSTDSSSSSGYSSSSCSPRTPLCCDSTLDRTRDIHRRELNWISIESLKFCSLKVATEWYSPIVWLASKLNSLLMYSYWYKIIDTRE